MRRVMELHPILQLIYLAVAVGGILMLFSLLPIDQNVKTVVKVLALIVIILWAIKWLLGQVS